MNNPTESLGGDEDENHPLPGDPIEICDLSIPKAIALADYVSNDATDYIALIGCRRYGKNDVLVIAVEPEVPQHPVNDIRRRETIVVEFDHDDRRQPRVTAARRSFPRVIHTNVGLATRPVDLCLFDRPYAEHKMSWTAARFASQLHRWLSKTARDELHDPDQPLEQLFIGTPHRLILPRSCLYTNGEVGEQTLVVRRVREEGGRFTMIAEESGTAKGRREPSDFALIAYEAKCRTHGLIDIQPGTLDELVQFLGDDGDGFLEALSAKLKRFQDAEKVDLELPLIMVVWFPKSRADQAEIESIDLWAFGTACSMLKLGAAIGTWGNASGATLGGVLLSRDTTKSGEGVELDLMTPTALLSQKDGARCNGIHSDRFDYVAVGAGSIGSHVLEQLVRSGYGRWTTIDDDTLLPHNVARHVLTGWAIGLPKAEALSRHLNSIYEDDPTRAIIANVIHDQSDELDDAFREAEGIVDLSASVAVSRKLAIDVESAGRRIASFLSPSGQDSVLLAEPEDRSMRLDLIEMEYYRALIHDERLAAHLQTTNSKYRYTNACRDVSVRLPHDAVVLHSTLASRHIRTLPDGTVAKVFRANESLLPLLVEIELGGYHQLIANGWHVNVSKPLLLRMRADRNEHLPNETGGLLIGSFDMSRQIAYVVDQIPAPVDSERRPTSYLRGCEGLEEQVEAIREKTKGQLDYVGEWHSHPGKSTNPSTKDKSLFAWLAHYRLSDGAPALMAIVGSESSRWIVGEIKKMGKIKHE